MLRHLCALSCAILFSFAILTQDGQAAPPVEAFGELPGVEDVKISPDGRQLAVLQSVQGKTIVTVYKVGAPAGTKPVVINPSQGKVRRVEWANNERLLVSLSTTWTSVHVEPRQTFEIWRWMSIKADATGATFLFRDAEFNNIVDGGGEVINWLPDDPDSVLIARLDPRTYSERGTRQWSRIQKKATRGLSVYKVNVNTGEEQEIERNSDNTRDWIADSNGTVRVRIDREKAISVSARGADAGRFQKIAQYPTYGTPESTMRFYGFAKNSNSIYVTARKDTDKRGVYTFDLASGKLSNKVFLHDTYDVNRVIIDRYTMRGIGARYTEHMPRTVYFDPAYADLQAKLENAFKGQSVSIISTSRDRNRLILFAHPPGVPGTFYFFDAKAREASAIGGQYTDISATDIGPVKPISYRARDGLTIPAYLTLPPGKEAKNLPMIVLPHGGPASRDSQSFHWWSQFYASRGYAVLQPNFRGSAGYGHKFLISGYGEWGGKMQDDLTDGVTYLIAEGIADPQRVCIVGGSYGGYAALAGAAFTPELYACAVSVAGVSDLVTFVGEAATGSYDDSYSTLYWERWLGPRIGATDKMNAASPAKHADNVQAPVLLIHGKDDSVVNLYQSQLMADALRKAGKAHRLITLEGEDHWLSQANSRIRMLKETEVFLKEHIGN